jgi:hypothetical protein
LRAAAPTDPAFHDLVARYDAEIIAVDEALGRLLDGLVARGLDGNTLVVVTSSQGTEFLEHDYVGHSWTLYDEVVRVPLVMAAPGRLDPGRIRTPVSLVDVFPTLIEVLGLPRSTVSLDGHSLLARDAATWRAGEREPGVVMELVIPEIGITRAVVVGNEKLITMQRTVEPGRRLAVAEAYPQIVSAMASGEIPRPPLWAPPVRSELFGLTADPGELTDLSAMSPERRRRLAAVLARYAEQCERDGLTPRWARPPGEAPEPGDLDELRQLGYL